MREDHAQLREALIGRLSAAPREQVWRGLVDAGVVGFRIAEARGGLGLGAADAEPVMEALGELCIGVPYLETSVIAAGLLADATSTSAGQILRAIAAGEAIVAVGEVERGLAPGAVSAARSGAGWTVNGNMRVVVDALAARYVLAPALADGELSLFVLETGVGGLAMHPVPTIDGRMAADISLKQVRATDEARIALPRDVATRVLDEATAAVCVEAASLMRRLVRDTVAYAKTREQFGQAIGSFQVVQHRLVDMNIAARRAAAISRRAMASLAGPASERTRAVTAAKVTVAQTGRFVGQNGVQLHGGMGMTEELGIGRAFKRLTVIEGQLGGADHHLRRFMAQSN